MVLVKIAFQIRRHRLPLRATRTRDTRSPPRRAHAPHLIRNDTAWPLGIFFDQFATIADVLARYIDKVISRRSLENLRRNAYRHAYPVSAPTTHIPI